MNEQCARPAVIEHVDIIVGPQHCIQWNGNRTYFDCSEKGGGKVRRVQQEQGYALLHINAQVEQTIANAIGQFRDLRVSISLPIVINGGFGSASLGEVTV